MTNLTSVSKVKIKQRRKHLKRRRQLKLLQACWRSLLAGSIAGSLLWALVFPRWTLQQPSQVLVKGNQFLSAQAIRSQVQWSYPQLLLQIEPQQLSEKLESQAPIAEATITRQLLPPSLTIQVKERRPVALALPPEQLGDSGSPAEVGFIDKQGVWMPKSSYIAPGENFEIPNLKVVAFKARYRPYWSNIYQTIRHSTVEIFALDWRNPSNLILKTDLGNVHLGSAYTHQFQEQLAVLARMRNLHTQVDSNRIAYIDLTTPESPSVQMKAVSLDRPESHTPVQVPLPSLRNLLME